MMGSGCQEEHLLQILVLRSVNSIHGTVPDKTQESGIVALSASVGERKVMHLAAVRCGPPNVQKAVEYKHLQSEYL